MTEPVVSPHHEDSASPYVQRKAQERITNGDADRCEHFLTLDDGTELWLVPSSRRGHDPYVCERSADGTWTCTCESRRPCHHPIVCSYKRDEPQRKERALWQRLMESQWVEYMEARA